MRFDVDAEPLVHLGRRERPTPARVAHHELPQRIRPAFEERLRQADRGLIKAAQDLGAEDQSASSMIGLIRL